MKKVLIPLAHLCLILSLLVACAPQKKEAEPTVESKQAIATNETPRLKTYTAQTGSFSIQAREDFRETVDSRVDQVLGKQGDSLSLESSLKEYYLTADRFYKADIAVAFPEFISRYRNLTLQSEELKQAPLKETTIADKKGYLLEATVEGVDALYGFYYEDGGFYKHIILQATQQNKETAKVYLEEAINSWEDHPVTPTFELTQSVTLPTTGMTITLPHTWKQEAREDGDPHTLDYYSPDYTYYVSLYSNIVEDGYTLNVPEFVASLAADISPSAISQEVTVGPHSGYLIDATNIVEDLRNDRVLVYIFQLDNRTVTIYFATPVSQSDAMRPIMEQIVASLQ